MNKRAAMPTNDTVALTAFLLGREWLCADEILFGLARLGFEKPSSQWLSARLTAMCKESAPRFERRPMLGLGSLHEYRVTSWALTGLTNQWAGFRSFRSGRSLPIPQPEGLAEAGQ
jgi:hypothetical protein